VLTVTVIAAVASACGSSDPASTTSDPPAAATAAIPSGDWTQFDFDAQRSGVGPTDTGITARNVRSLKVRRIHLDGTVDSAAIELHAITVRGRVRDVAVMTTTYGRTIAIDPGTGSILWQFVPHGISSYEGSYQITTGTPIADPNRRFVYAASPDGLVHKLALENGREVRAGHWPVRITLNPGREKITSSLNLTGNLLVAMTGGYIGDAPPYQGHVVTIDRDTGQIRHVWNSLCSNRQRLIVPSTCSASDSAIWSRAGATIEPDTGRILVATGNGPFNGSTNWGDSVLELSPDGARLLHNWTPTDQAELNASDTDLGSTSPALLPPTGGRRLAVQGGKQGNLALLDLNRLNGTTSGASARTGGELQRIATPGGGELFTAPVVWTHAGRTYLFVADDSGTGVYVLSGGSHPRLRTVAENGTPGTSPVLAGGLLYVYDEQDGFLKVYEPTHLVLLASLPAAVGHWNSPIVVGGRIILPEGNANDHATSGTVDVFHLPGR
jgi:hypothetical protein